jgi:hypothetical protein
MNYRKSRKNMASRKNRKMEGGKRKSRKVARKTRKGRKTARKH